MPGKAETNNILGTYDLVFTHDEIIDLMNSEEMALGGAELATDQILEIWAEQVFNGKERILLSHFREGCNLIIRLRKATLEETSTDVGTVVIQQME